MLSTQRGARHPLRSLSSTRSVLASLSLSPTSHVVSPTSESLRPVERVSNLTVDTTQNYGPPRPARPARVHGRHPQQPGFLLGRRRSSSATAAARVAGTGTRARRPRTEWSRRQSGSAAASSRRRRRVQVAFEFLANTLAFKGTDPATSIQSTAQELQARALAD